MFWPLLMPETIRSGRWSSRPVSATCTQSLGVPLTTVVPSAACQTVSGRFSVSELLAPLLFCSGATTVTSPSGRMAAASAAMPGAR